MVDEGNNVSGIFGADASEQNAVVPAEANGEPAGEAIAAPPPPPVAPAAPAATAAQPAPGSTVASGNLEMFKVGLEDKLYQSGISLPPGTYDKQQLKVGLATLGLAEQGGSIINDNADGESSILINSDRVIINSKTSHTIIAGAEGVALTSTNKVNIDADESVTIFGMNGVFLGVPNKGAEPSKGVPPEIANAGPGFFKRGEKKLKSYPSPDVPYEPMVLGLKLVNWLDDLLVILKNLQILTGVGLATPREDGQWDFLALQARLPELVSNYIFLDGYSHDQMDYDTILKNVSPTADDVTKPKTSINVNMNLIASPAPGAALTPTVPSGPNANKPGYGESGGVLASLTGN